MANAERTPLWKRWWVWCIVCLVLAGVVANETKRLYEAQKTVLEEIGPSWFSPAGGNSPEAPNSKAAKEPSLSDAASDGKTPNTTGDSQVDAYLRGEIRRWQEDFGFDETVLVESIRRSIHAFRPFLLFRGGREAVQEVCRDAHDDADRSRRRLNRAGQNFGRAGREETLQRGTYLFNSIEAAAADWLQDKTLENVDPEVPAGGWTHGAGTVLHVARGNVVNASGRLIWPGRPDLPTSVNARLAAALMEWVDEFQLSEEDVPPLSRAVLSRLLVLQPGSSGLGPTESARTARARRGCNGCARHATRLAPCFAAPDGSTCRTSSGCRRNRLAARLKPCASRRSSRPARPRKPR